MAEEALKAVWGPDWLAKAIREVKAGSVSCVRTLVWAGLLAKNPTLTEREVGAMGFDLRKAVAAVEAGFRRSTWN